jgi:hypothetical protein
MMESWSEPGFTKRGRVRMGIMGGIGTWLGVIFVILGFIGETTESIIGLYPTSWYLVAIASFCWMGWAVGLYYHVKETEGK